MLDVSIRDVWEIVVGFLAFVVFFTAWCVRLEMEVRALKEYKKKKEESEKAYWDKLDTIMNLLSDLREKLARLDAKLEDK